MAIKTANAAEAVKKLFKATSITCQMAPLRPGISCRGLFASVVLVHPK